MSRAPTVAGPDELAGERSPLLRYCSSNAVEAFGSVGTLKRSFAM